MSPFALEYAGTTQSTTVRGRFWEVGFEGGAGWVLSSLHAATDGVTHNTQLIYRDEPRSAGPGPGSREKWSGVLFYNPTIEGEEIFPNSDDRADGPLVITQGPALVHLQKSWSVPTPNNNFGYVGTTDYVLHADGRIHIYYDTQTTGDAVDGGWLVSYLALNLEAIASVSADTAPPIAVPIADGVEADRFEFLYDEEEEDAIPARPQVLCARGSADNEELPGTVALARVGHPGATLARITESAEGAQSSYSIKLQYDFARHGVPRGDYQGAFVLTVAGTDDCGERIQKRLGGGVAPPGLNISYGGELKRDEPRDAEGDGFVEGLGYYHVLPSRDAVALENRRLDFNFDQQVESTTLVLDGVEGFRSIEDVVLHLNGNALVPGENYLVQYSDRDRRVYLVLFNGDVNPRNTYTIRW